MASGNDEGSQTLISTKEGRLIALNDRWLRLGSVIMARALEHRNISGGGSGLLVKEERGVGSSSVAKVVEEYVVDFALLKEMRAMEQQAAIELGQWRNDAVVGGQTNLSALTDDELREFNRLRAKVSEL